MRRDEKAREGVRRRSRGRTRPQAPAREYKILDDKQVKIKVVRRGKAKKEKQAERVSALEFTRT